MPAPGERDSADHRADGGMSGWWSRPAPCSRVTSIVLVGRALSDLPGESTFVGSDACSTLRDLHTHHLATAIAPVGFAPSRWSSRRSLLASAPWSRRSGRARDQCENREDRGAEQASASQPHPVCDGHVGVPDLVLGGLVDRERTLCG